MMLQATDTHSAAASGVAEPAARMRLKPVTLTALVVAIIAYGGYARHWGWLGIDGRTATLWDWLHLLLLPIVALLLSIWVEHRPALGRRTRAAGAMLAATFLALVLAGYTIPWAWTGFTGNRLWDWMNLAALPLAVAVIPVAPDLRERWERRHSVIGLVVGGTLAVVVLGGYLWGWGWTGFAGNTLWDWLHLLLLPLLLPLVITPTIKPSAKAWLGRDDEPAPADAGAEGRPTASAPGVTETPIVSTVSGGSRQPTPTQPT